MWANHSFNSWVIKRYVEFFLPNPALCPGLRLSLLSALSRLKTPLLSLCWLSLSYLT